MSNRWLITRSQYIPEHVDQHGRYELFWSTITAGNDGNGYYWILLDSTSAVQAKVWTAQSQLVCAPCLPGWLMQLFWNQSTSGAYSMEIDVECKYIAQGLSARGKDYVIKKCQFSSAKKWHLERPNLRSDSKSLAKHLPKWWNRHLVHAFPFSGEYQANFEKSHIFHRFGVVLPSKWGQNFKPVSSHENIDRDFSIPFCQFFYFDKLIQPPP